MKIILNFLTSILLKRESQLLSKSTLRYHIPQAEAAVMFTDLLEFIGTHPDIVGENPKQSSDENLQKALFELVQQRAQHFNISLPNRDAQEATNIASHFILIIENRSFK